MKYLSAIIIAMLFSMTAMAQNDAISTYFDQYVDDENFTVVYVSGKMFSMLSKVEVDELKDEEAQVIMDVAKDIKGLRVPLSRWRRRICHGKFLRKIRPQQNRSTCQYHRYERRRTS